MTYPSSGKSKADKSKKKKPAWERISNRLYLISFIPA
jgi:hypothetical protein